MKRFISALIHRITVLFGGRPADPMAELRAALEAQIERDERSRKRWGDHG